MTAIIHKTRTLSDHRASVTLCGLPILTDHAHTDHVKSTEPWVSCPLCEAALILDSNTPDQPMNTGYTSKETQ